MKAVALSICLEQGHKIDAIPKEEALAPQGGSMGKVTKYEIICRVCGMTPSQLLRLRVAVPKKTRKEKPDGSKAGSSAEPVPGA